MVERPPKSTKSPSNRSSKDGRYVQVQKSDKKGGSSKVETNRGDKKKK
jgi:hypothetical protein